MVSQRPIDFGKYILLDRIAIGGMAEIFRAKATGAASFEKILAIKRIHPNMSDDKDFIKMFIDEAKIVGQLAHQNIAQIFELGRIEGHHFIAMEFIWGKDLLQILTKFKKQRAYMNPYQASFVTARICEALDYAHRKKNPVGELMGIIHRDVSPQNILVSYNGEVKIIDFGIAKARDRSSHTAAGVLKGKFGYMSPEQVRGLPIDHRSDIFAIGTLLYEMLTSRPLFVGNSDLDVLEKVRNVEVPPPRQVNPKIPVELEVIIMKALAKDVDDRYQWASEMQDDLEKFIHSITPIYTAKRLGEWMSKVFAPEKSKEQQSLDTMLHIAEEMLNPDIAEAKTQMAGDVEEKTVMMDDEDEAMLAGAGGGVNIAEEKTRFLMDDEEEDEFEVNEEATRLLEDDEDINTFLPQRGNQDLAEQKTQFLDDDDDDGPPVLSEAKTMLYDEDDPGMQVPGIRPQMPPQGHMGGGPSMPGPAGPPPRPSQPVPDMGIPGLPSAQPAVQAPAGGVSKDDFEAFKKKMTMILVGASVGALVLGLIIGKVL